MEPRAAGELGDLLRAWRDRMTPEDAGINHHGRRRAAGLRREELASLAGVSVDDITRLEQGRATSPSAQVVMALARALQLDTAETDLLHRSAGLLPPATGLITRRMPPSVQRLAIRLGDLPVAAFAGDWTLLWSSGPWDALFPASSPNLNLARAAFDNPESALPLAADADAAARFETALVADLRHASSVHPDDPQLRNLVSDLRTRSDRFSTIWDSGAVAVHRSERKSIRTSLVGEITLDCDVLTLPDSDVKIVVYTAAHGTEDAGKLEFLRVAALRTFQST